MRKFRKSVATILAFLMIFGCLSFTSQAAAGNKLVTLYAADGSTISSLEDNVEAYLASGWSTEPFVKMYAMDGTEYSIRKEDVETYKNLGLYESLDGEKTTLYAPDGRESIVFSSEVEKHVAQGWYTVPVTYMYAQDGTEYVIAKSEVEAYKAVGLFENWWDVFTYLYSPVGELQVVLNRDLQVYLAGHWSYTMPKTYFETDVPNFAYVTDTPLKEIYNADNGIVLVYAYCAENYNKYKDFLESNGWWLHEHTQGTLYYKKGNARVQFCTQGGDLKVEIDIAALLIDCYNNTSVPDYERVTGRGCLHVETTVNDYNQPICMYVYELKDNEYEAYLLRLKNDGWELNPNVSVNVDVMTMVFEQNGARFIVTIDSFLNKIAVIVAN